MPTITLQNTAQKRPQYAPTPPSPPAERFGAGVFTKAAVSQFWGDTAGVWLPKMPTVRSWPQAFEETFLEFVEDLAFYFGLPMMGQYGLGKLFAKRGGLKPEAWQNLGVHTAKLEEKLGHALPKNLVAAKAGALVGMLALASGFEYLIQPVRNMITAKAFGVKNFTAVAGLESARDQLASDERDPMAKGKRRLWQVGLITAGLLGGALVLPKAILRSSALENGARKLLRYVDFGGQLNAQGKPDNLFDITKPLLATIVTTGVISYLDAARDSLERKETALRLGLVAPYLVFGQDLIANAVAWFSQRKPLPDAPPGVRIGDKVPYLSKSWGAMGRDALRPGPAFLNTKIVHDGKDIVERLAQLQANPATALTPSQINAVQRGFQQIELKKYFFSALVMSIGLNLSAYAITRMRFHKRQQQATQAAQTQSLAASPTPRPAFSPPRSPFAASAPPAFHAASPSLSGAQAPLRRASAFAQAFGAA